MAGSGRRYAPEFKARMVELVQVSRSLDRLAHVTPQALSPVQALFLICRARRDLHSSSPWSWRARDRPAAGPRKDGSRFLIVLLGVGRGSRQSFCAKLR